MTMTLNMSMIMKDGATDMRNKRSGSLDREKIDTLRRFGSGRKRHRMVLIVFPGGTKVVMNEKTGSQLTETLNLDTGTTVIPTLIQIEIDGTSRKGERGWPKR